MLSYGMLCISFFLIHFYQLRFIFMLKAGSSLRKEKGQKLLVAVLIKYILSQITTCLGIKKLYFLDGRYIHTKDSGDRFKGVYRGVFSFFFFKYWALQDLLWQRSGIHG